MISVRMDACARFLAALSGWRRFGAAFAFGALGALAFPPMNLTLVLWVSFPALIFMLRGAERPRAAFAIGWWFAFGHLTICLHWIAGALLVDPQSHGFLVPFAVFGLPALFAVYYGIAALGARLFGLEQVAGLVVFALCWFWADYARGHWFTGFPWDVLGYVWADCLPMMQAARLLGVDGLTLITALVAVLPAVWGMTIGPVRRVAATGLALGVLVAGYGYGALSLQGAGRDFVPDVRLRLVQPDMPQAKKWAQDERQAHFDALLDLSFGDDMGQAGQRITHVIWPETATALLLDEDRAARLQIAERMGIGSGRQLMTGALRRAVDEKGHLSYYNAFLVLDDIGRVVGRYDKHHLVPFGEYMPARGWIPVPAIAGMGVDFAAGPGPQTLVAEGGPSLSPLVCYEAIFSGAVRARESRPDILMNVTNDAWYDGTMGPAQHFAIARMRAVEEGIPLVRVANQGVVAVVDPWGRIVARFQGNGAGFVDSPLPRSLPQATPFGRAGEELVFVCAWILLILASFARKRQN